MSLGFSGLLEGTYNKLVLILNDHGQLPDYRKVLRLHSKIQAWANIKAAWSERVIVDIHKHIDEAFSHWKMSWQTGVICINFGVNRKILQLCEVFI